MTAKPQPRRLLRREDVEHLTSLRRTALQAREDAGMFPPRIRLSTTLNVWPSDEIDAYIAAVTRGTSDDEMRALVKRLVEQRAQASAA